MKTGRVGGGRSHSRAHGAWEPVDALVAVVLEVCDGD